MRNYTMEYIRTLLPVLIELFGPAEGGWLGRFTARLIGMQYYDRTAALLGIAGHGAEEFARYLARFGEAQGDVIALQGDENGVGVRQQEWRLMRGLAGLSPAVFDAWNGLWEGSLAVHNRHLRLEVVRRLDAGDPCNEWRVRPRQGSPAG
jgi:hypothetical protein